MEYDFHIYCIYGIPSAILNFSLIICILSHKTFFQASFYRVYAFTLIVYLLTYLNTWITLKLPTLRALASFYANVEQAFWPFRLFIMFQGAAFHIQNLAQILMHLNRFTSVFLPIRHHTLWSPRNINIAFFLAYLIGILLSYQYFFLNGSVFIQVGATTIQGAALRDQYAISAFIVKIMGYVYPPISLGLNILIFAKMFLLRRRKKRDDTWSRVELNLFFIGFCTMITQLGLLLFLNFGLQFVDLTIIYFAMNLASDLSTLSEAYIGLAINQQIRRKFIEMFHKMIDMKSMSQRIDITPRPR
ncbi:unnamed protein product, partial [Mesorhabditis belari]|uniref:Serpentine receptor class gamma n=1 Tax=Mesorhabditis belari TaxID=2138241 RepID=A0AAF3J864_9BILA